jgi:hypothetical protein
VIDEHDQQRDSFEEVDPQVALSGLRVHERLFQTTGGQTATNATNSANWAAKRSVHDSSGEKSLANEKRGGIGACELKGSGHGSA